MTYFLLSKPYLYTYKYLQITEIDEYIQPYVSNSLYYYLCDIKEKIHLHEKEWDIYKKYTNPYEFIHSNLPNKKKCISKYRPLSRAFFKMIELLHILNVYSTDSSSVKIDLNNVNGFSPPISVSSVSSRSPSHPLNQTNDIDYMDSELGLDFIPEVAVSSSSFIPVVTPSLTYSTLLTKKTTPRPHHPYPPHPPHPIQSISKRDYGGVGASGMGYRTPIRSFHLAEGPGGFIEALLKYRANPYDIYVGMTIVNDYSTDSNIPAWTKSGNFLKENKNVFIETGKDKTGNILNLQNFVYCKEKYKSSMDIITADGGFDFSVDFNSQEINISRLLFAQIAYGVCMQKKGGTFILKVFDTFMLHTIDLIYLLSSFYKKVHIVKLNTSRVANSEKYILCQEFLFDSCDDFYSYFYNSFYQMSRTSRNIVRFLNLNIPHLFIEKIEEINSIAGQQQIENIYLTLSLIDMRNKNSKIDTMVKNNIQKCVQWCIKHQIPYYPYIEHGTVEDRGMTEKRMHHGNLVGNGNGSASYRWTSVKEKMEKSGWLGGTSSDPMETTRTFTNNGWNPFSGGLPNYLSSFSDKSTRTISTHAVDTVSSSFLSNMTYSTSLHTDKISVEETSNENKNQHKHKQMYADADADEPLHEWNQFSNLYDDADADADAEMDMEIGCSSTEIEDLVEETQCI